MFNKLVSNLPFNPSLINQVSFYTKRLKQEASVRRLGFILVALTMFLQLFAVLSPAQTSFATPGNDLIPGGVSGVTSKDRLIQHCQNNDYGYKTILAHFAISCANLQNNSVVTTVKSTDRKNNQPLYSMGRQSQGPINLRTGKATDETAFNVAGIEAPFYMRLLTSWDGGSSSTYQALSVGNAFNIQFYILFSCGNIVEFGPPPPPAPKPTPPPKPTPKPPPTPKPTPKPPPSPTKPCTASKNVNDVLSCLIFNKKARNVTQNIANANNTTANAGDTIEYTLLVKNTAKVAYKNFVVRENLSDVLEYADISAISGAAKDSTGNVKWAGTDIGAGKTIQKQFQIKVKSPIPQTPSPCPPTSTVKPCPRSNSFDLIMTNVYGSTTINVRLPGTIIKTTETVTTTTLPNTGPGTSLLIGFAGTAVIGYFYARSRLLAKELDIVRKDYGTSGGI